VPLIDELYGYGAPAATADADEKDTNHDSVVAEGPAEITPAAIKRTFVFRLQFLVLLYIAVKLLF